MKRFVVDNFPDDLAKRLRIHVAITGESRRELVIKAIETILKAEEEKAKRQK